MNKAYLILADGTVFEGQSLGAQGKTIGETVFTTGMTGYLETLTDPSYFGQIVVQTFPLIGNYGVIKSDFESKKSFVKGYIVREACDLPSNFRCEGKLNDFLESQGITGLCGIDTRQLTKKIRESGVMNGMILSGKEGEDFSKEYEKSPETAKKIVEKIAESLKEYKITEAVKNVGEILSKKDGTGSENETASFPSKPSEKTQRKSKNIKIALWNFGAKANIQRELEKRGATVIDVPYSATAKDILSLKPDGLMLSNGPGDPSENTQIIQELQKIIEKKIPTFGICLGHQILALARGATTKKLKYGHRGGNHPVKNLETGRVYITSQNHGYAVETGDEKEGIKSSLPDYAKLSFVNANDGTCEGIRYTDIPAFSVQFHPEACSGPKDTGFLFDEFIKMIETDKDSGEAKCL